MTINLSVPASHELKPRITVFGVGGAGGNAVNNMITSHLEGVEFVVANTDAQSLSMSLTERRIQLGVNSTHGLGAGARPDVGRAAAEEVLDLIEDHLQGCNMAFITAGMGGGTGTGATPVIARRARELGILTVGVVTKPFHFEGKHRMAIAEAGIESLQSVVDTLIVIPNQNLFRVANETTTFADAFKMADDVLYSGVRGVTDLMVMPGLINLDFADVRAVMMEMGKAMMGTGEAEGTKRALEAAEAAINNPLLDDVSLKGARGVLVNITGGPDMTLYEVDEACNHIRDQVDPDANIIFGSTFDESLAGRVRVSVVATGIDVEASQRAEVMAMQNAAIATLRQKTEPRPTRPAAALGASTIEARFEPMVDLTELAEAAPATAEARVPEPAYAGGDPLAPARTATAASRPAPGSTFTPRFQPEPTPSPLVAPEARAHAAEGRRVTDGVRSAAAAAAPAAPMAASQVQPQTLRSRAEVLAELTARHAARIEPTAYPSRQSEPAPESRPSLFERMTRSGRARTAPRPDAQPSSRTPAAELRPQAPAEARMQAQATTAEPIAVGRSDDDLLDSPAFLRRQAN